MIVSPKVTVKCSKQQENTVYVATIHAAVPRFKINCVNFMAFYRDPTAFLRLRGLKRMPKAFLARRRHRRPRGVRGHAPPENFYLGLNEKFCISGLALPLSRSIGRKGLSLSTLRDRDSSNWSRSSAIKGMSPSIIHISLHKIQS